MNDIFFELFSELPRQAPGDNEYTRQALQYFSLRDNPKILDIGCGSGMQTLELARLTAGEIIAVDNYPPYLEELQTKAEQNGYRIKTQPGDMLTLPFADESFDLVWAEGSIYIMGMEKALQQWRHLLVPNGGIAFTEITWLDENPPKKILNYWNSLYDKMSTIDKNIQTIEKNGYEFLDAFVLPEKAWWKNYYTPLEKRLNTMRNKHIDVPEAQIVFEETRTEIEMYRQYSAWYSFVFYMAVKI